MKKLLQTLAFTIIGILIISTFHVGTVVKAQQTSLDTSWSFTVTGLVDNPLNLTVSDLEAMPQTVIAAAIYCVDSGPSIPLYSWTHWTGVQLSYILGLAGVKSSAVKVAFNASDGYSTDLNISRATSGDVILAYENDEGPLIGTLRLVVPREWGYKWISQVTGIVLVDYDFKGTWESKGYPDIANIQSDTNPLDGVQEKTNPWGNNAGQQTANSPPSNSSTTLPPARPQNSESEPKTSPTEGFPAELVAFAIVAVGVGACLLGFTRTRRHRSKPLLARFLRDSSLKRFVYA